MTNPKNAGRKPIDGEVRKDRRYTVTDLVHERLKQIGNGSASQGIADLVNGKCKTVDKIQK